MSHWQVIDEDPGVWVCEYEFAPGAKTNAFATRIANGKIMVASPPTGAADSVYDELASFGEVAAIVTNNGFHHLGLADWKTRFPDARVFADPLAAKRIAKKNRNAPTLEPIANLQPLLGDDVVLTAAPATKCGEGWVSVKSGRGHVWYASDVLSNFQSLPPNFFVRTLFKLTGSKTGYGVFHTAMKFIVADRKRVLRQMLDEVNDRMPAVMVPAHGPILDSPDLADRTRAILNEAIS